MAGIEHPTPPTSPQRGGLKTIKPVFTFKNAPKTPYPLERVGERYHEHFII
jgi:hypothetical protein